MDCSPIPQLCLCFLSRSKKYLKEHPPSASIADEDFLLSRCKIHSYTVVYYIVPSPQCQTLVRIHCRVHFLVHSIATSNVNPPSRLSLMQGAVGPIFQSYCNVTDLPDLSLETAHSFTQK